MNFSRAAHPFSNVRFVVSTIPCCISKDWRRNGCSGKPVEVTSRNTVTVITDRRRSDSTDGRRPYAYVNRVYRGQRTYGGTQMMIDGHWTEMGTRRIGRQRAFSAHVFGVHVITYRAQVHRTWLANTLWWRNRLLSVNIYHRLLTLNGLNVFDLLSTDFIHT